MRGLLRLLVPAVALAALSPATAYAAWNGAGSGAGSASADSVLRASPPTPTRGAGSVGLSWSPSTLSSGRPVGRYDVIRHQGTTSTVVCSGVTTTACTDSSPLAGPVQYGVVGRVGTSWTGPESAPAGFTYDDAAPTTTLATTPATPDGLNSWYVHDVTVTLSAVDPGSPASGVKEIHYTVNGGAETVVPGSSATLTVTQEQANTISYWAVDNNGNAQSPVGSGTVRLDKSRPVSAITTNDAAGWNTTGTVTLAATDGPNGSGVASILDKVDGAAQYSTYSSALVLTDGTRTVTYHAVDNAGNAEADRTATVKVDTVKPTASVSPASGATTNTVTITGVDATSGVHHVEYRLDGAATYTTGSSITWAAGSGAHTVVYRAVDNAGNVGDAATATFTASSSLAAPVVSCGTTAKKLVNVSWTAVTGATSYDLYYPDGLTLATNQTGTTFPLSIVGQSGIFQVKARNASGTSPFSNVLTYDVGNGSNVGTCR